MNRLARFLCRLAVACLTATFLLVFFTNSRSSRATTVLVPAYFYPTDDGAKAWERLCQAARSIQVQAVINPASGPGTTADPNYAAIVEKFRAAGGKVLGYVHTSYGDREIGLVQSDIKNYLDMYHVDGFFIDEMRGDPLGVHYYSSLYNFIKRQNQALEVVGNPGIVPNEAYVKQKTADRLVIFEGGAADFQDHLPARWVRQYRPDRFVHIVYDARTAEQMLRVLDRNAGLHAAAVFISDGAGSNPYDRLPSYWEREVLALKAARP
jgi:hypothetical protein